MTNLLLYSRNEVLVEFNEVGDGLNLPGIDAIQFLNGETAVTFTRPGYVEDFKLNLVKPHVDGTCSRCAAYNTISVIVPHLLIYKEACGTKIPFLAIQEHPDVDGRFSQFVEVVRSQIERDFQFFLHTINLLMQLFVAKWGLCVTQNTQF